MHCPNCKTDTAQRSHRASPWERLIGLAGCRRYRCLSCNRRFVRRHDQSPEPTAPRGVLREISATRSAMRWKQKRRDFLLYGSALILFAVLLYYLTREPSMGD
jgi:hypothetical protein